MNDPQCKSNGTSYTEKIGANFVRRGSRAGNGGAVTTTAKRSSHRAGRSNSHHMPRRPGNNYFLGKRASKGKQMYMKVFHFKMVIKQIKCPL